MARDDSIKKKYPNVVLLPVLYNQYLHPNGYLNEDPASHALFHYCNCGMQNYKERIENPGLELALDHQTSMPIQTYNYHQLFLSVAKLYGVDPNNMEKYWAAVTLQYIACGVTEPVSEVRNPKRCLQ